MKEHFIRLDFDFIEPVYYNMEPFENVLHSNFYKKAFKIEWEKIFTVIGKEHIPKILKIFYQYQTYLGKSQFLKKKRLREQALPLLIFLDSDNIFDDEITFEQLESYFDEFAIEGVCDRVW